MQTTNEIKTSKKTASIRVVSLETPLVLEFELSTNSTVAINGAGDSWKAYVKARSFPADRLTDGPNPREHANVTGAVAKAIKRTLKEEPAMFQKKNGGITILAHSCVHDVENRKLIVTFIDVLSHGAIDGGTTVKVIEEFVKNELDDAWDPDESCEVSIEVVTGVHGRLIGEISQARNERKGLSQMEKVTISGVLDKWQGWLSTTYPSNRLRWSSYSEDGKDAMHLFQVAMAVHPDLVSDSVHKLSFKTILRSPGALFKKMEKDSAFKAKFDNLTPILKDMFLLHDIILLTWLDSYTKSLKGKKVDPFTGDKGVYALKPIVDPGQDNRISRYLDPHRRLQGANADYAACASSPGYVLLKAYTIALCSVFGPLVNSAEGQPASWVTDPFVFWNKQKDALVPKILDCSKAVGPNEVSNAMHANLLSLSAAYVSGLKTV